MLWLTVKQNWMKWLLNGLIAWGMPCYSKNLKSFNLLGFQSEVRKHSTSHSSLLTSCVIIIFKLLKLNIRVGAQAAAWLSWSMYMCSCLSHRVYIAKRLMLYTYFNGVLNVRSYTQAAAWPSLLCFRVKCSLIPRPHPLRPHPLSFDVHAARGGIDEARLDVHHFMHTVKN